MSNYAKYKDLGEQVDSFNTAKQPQQLTNNNSVRNNVVREPFNQQPQQQMSNNKPSYPNQSLPVIDVKTIEEKKHYIANNKVCVVYIYGTFCEPCKQIASRYVELINKYNKLGLCMLLKENVENGLSNCRGVPTFQFFKDGNYLNTDIVGADILSVEKKVQELLNS